MSEVEKAINLLHTQEYLKASDTHKIIAALKTKP